MQASWISSMAEFSCIIVPMLSMVNARRICEIGASAGTHSKVLADTMRQQGGRLISIDPRPQTSYLDWLAKNKDVAAHIPDYSLAAIPAIGKVDAWFLDGDHNWYTVYHELLCIESEAAKHRYAPLIFLHDMNWPCARRDMYYDPSRIPAEYLQPHSAEISITLDNPGIVKDGFRGGTWAMTEGGPRNGILTALEDFVKQSKSTYHWIHVPAVLGLGILIDEKHPLADKLVEFCSPYHDNPLIAKLERDRVEKYLAICALQQKLDALSSRS